VSGLAKLTDETGRTLVKRSSPQDSPPFYKILRLTFHQWGAGTLPTSSCLQHSQESSLSRILNAGLGNITRPYNTRHFFSSWKDGAYSSEITPHDVFRHLIFVLFLSYLVVCFVFFFYVTSLLLLLLLFNFFIIAYFKYYIHNLIYYIYI